MKQSLILWLAAFIITFLFGFWNRISSPEYPVSESFGIGMKRVSYKFDKVYRGNDDYKIVVGTEADSLSGKILWKKEGASGWNEIPMTQTGKIITGEIPAQPPRTIINYRVKIWKSNKIYYLPQSKAVTLKFLANVPASIMGFYFLTLYLGLVLSTRVGLEFFNDKQKIKKLSLFTILVWIANALIFSPVKRTYELSPKVGTKILSIPDLFDSHLLFPLLWIIATIIIFNSTKYRHIALSTSVVTLIIFLFIK